MPWVWLPKIEGPAVRLRILGLASLLAISPAALAADPGKDGADILYRFTGGTDGGGPFGGLVRDSLGNLYGTTAAGGVPGCQSPVDAPGCGVVFELSPPASGHGAWTETVLYTFTGGTDGNGPLAGLTRDSSGNLFGTTEAGGADAGGCALGCGIAFEISPPAAGQTVWTETVLHRFGATSSDGQFPSAAMVEDADGNLYSTTPAGGAAGLGTVFELSPQAGGGWSETILHDFQIGDGSAPIAGLLLDEGGTLYGTGETGSTGGKLCQALDDCGTVFSLSPPSGGQTEWAFSVLFRFPGDDRDGLYPLGTLIKDPEGRLVGTTSNFGTLRGQQTNGTVFRLSPPTQAGQAWKLRTLFYFTTIGSYPNAGVLQGPHHVLYGTTLQAGTGIAGGGLVYALAPPAPGSTSWQETKLFSFPKPGDGAMPLAGLIADPQGRLYGTASIGGDAPCNVPFCGTVYRVTPPK